jgi:apolipoprotein N-acyltransferase
VRVAALTARAVDMTALMKLLDVDRKAFRRETAALREAYLAGTLREARAGARLIAWPELAGVGVEEDEDELIVRGRALARAEDVYLAIALATVYADPERPYQNKLIVIDPNGEIVLEHLKFGGVQIEGFAPGDRVLRTVDTPFGRLSGVVCWDMDFPDVIRQAGRNGTDILLAPSYEWREIDPLHAQMAVFRAVENGVSLVHPSDGGRALATDAYGRVLAQADHYAGGERVLVAQLPTRGVTTLYPWLGDWVGWASLAWVALLLGRVALSRAASRRAASR